MSQASTQQALDSSSTNPIQEESKSSTSMSTSKLSKLNPFHSHRDKQKDQVPPKLQEAIQQMEERKRVRLEEMEKQGKKPNTSSDKSGAVPVMVGAALDALSGN
ncbi:hypothetical protein K491DRAFT_711095 [Lophiostoma macrostomum CBS 122681]|uniref:Uncharacterized protein n=1 Tax=Lophiostoma macrostomum CBS 122681 TaxID=1314788 RepID=A0A6A6TMA3_9PLEO|nr:hypothetical protein K491DRAFT_711095 [Lophiostoma macrostomum CBS 122681]